MALIYKCENGRWGIFLGPFVEILPAWYINTVNLLTLGSLNFEHSLWKWENAYVLKSQGSSRTNDEVAKEGME